MKSPLHRPPLNAWLCKNNCAGCYEPPRRPLFSSREDNYRTHDPWVFLKPRLCLNSFIQIHYLVASGTGSLPASQPARQPVSPFPSSTAMDGQQGQAEAGRQLGNRHGVSAEFLARDRIPKSIYFHSWLPRPLSRRRTLREKSRVLMNLFWLC